MRFTEGWAALLSTTGPLVGAYLGYLAAGRNEAHRDQRALLAAREQARYEREEAARGRAETFELEVLRDLFATLHARFRLQGSSYVAYRSARRQQPDVLPRQVPHAPSDGQEAQELQAELTRLAWLVLDDDLRNEVERVSDLLLAY